MKLFRTAEPQKMYTQNAIDDKSCQCDRYSPNVNEKMGLEADKQTNKAHDFSRSSSLPAPLRTTINFISSIKR